MANPTTYFGWVMPTSSSLVTNLPADFNTFGQGVDTSLQDLLGGTTGQVLSKTSNTNMDFTWVTPTDQTPLTTKGDLFTFSTVDARLAVGTNGQTLVADSSTATGLKWATPASSGPTNSGAVITNYESTTSTSYTALSTAGPAVTLTTGTKALVAISSFLGNRASMSFDISGASSFSAADTKAVQENSDNSSIGSGVYLMTGLTAGSNTFTAKYRSTNGTSAPFQNRNIAVIDMGS